MQGSQDDIRWKFVCSSVDFLTGYKIESKESGYHKRRSAAFAWRCLSAGILRLRISAFNMARSAALRKPVSKDGVLGQAAETALQSGTLQGKGR